MSTLRRSSDVRELIRTGGEQLSLRFVLKHMNAFTVLLMMNVSNGYGSYGPLSVKTTRFAFDEVGNKVLDKLCSSLFNDYTLAFSNVSSVYEMLPVRLGMLGCSFPGSGKRRIFAIGNYVIQRMLKGPHDWCASLLKTLKTYVIIKLNLWII